MQVAVVYLMAIFKSNDDHFMYEKVIPELIIVTYFIDSER